MDQKNQTNATGENKQTVVTTTQEPELTQEELEQVSGGLLLPAVQKVREAAARMKC